MNILPHLIGNSEREYVDTLLLLIIDLTITTCKMVLHRKGQSDSLRIL